MANNKDPEALYYENKLRQLGFNYHFDEYSTKQLKVIYLKSVETRKKVCKEIADLARRVGVRFNLTNLYNSPNNIDDLRRIKAQYEEDNRRMDIVDKIMYYAEILNKSQEFIAQNMFLGPKSTLDLEDTLFKLEKELYELELEAMRKETHDTIHYDANFAIGDDPLLDYTEKTIVIPKEKVENIVKTLDTLKRRRKNKSLYLDNIPKKKYDHLLAKYHDLDNNYPKLSTEDFEWLINFYNLAIDSLDSEYEEIEEQHYIKHI